MSTSVKWWDTIQRDTQKINNSQKVKEKFAVWKKFAAEYNFKKIFYSEIYFLPRVQTLLTLVNTAGVLVG